MRCGKCGKDIQVGAYQCPYCQAPVHYGGNTKFYNQAAQNKVNITDFFSNIFSLQPAGAGDKMFISGTALTTPTPDRMLQEWNKPWLYARFLLFGLIVCLLCYFMFSVQEHPGGLFLLFFFGSLVMPLYDEGNRVENNFSRLSSPEVVVLAGENVLYEFPVRLGPKKIFKALEIYHDKDNWTIHFIGLTLDKDLAGLCESYGVEVL